MYLIKQMIMEEWLTIGFFMDLKDRDEAFERFVLPMAKINKTWVKKEDEGKN